MGAQTTVIHTTLIRYSQLYTTCAYTQFGQFSAPGRLDSGSARLHSTCLTSKHINPPCPVQSSRELPNPPPPATFNCRRGNTRRAGTGWRRSGPSSGRFTGSPCSGGWPSVYPEQNSQWKRSATTTLSMLTGCAPEASVAIARKLPEAQTNHVPLSDAALEAWQREVASHGASRQRRRHAAATLRSLSWLATRPDILAFFGAGFQPSSGAAIRKTFCHQASHTTWTNASCKHTHHK